MSNQVYLKVHQNGGISFIGSWTPANERVDNFEQQKDLGWHVFLALQKGASKVEIVCGDQDAESKAYMEQLHP